VHCTSSHELLDQRFFFCYKRCHFVVFRTLFTNLKYSNRMYLAQNNGQEKIEEGKKLAKLQQVVNTDEFLMSFFFITEGNYDGC